MPVTARTFLVGSVAIAGLPPLNGFISEFLIYYAAFQGLQLNGLDMFLAMAAIIALAVIGGLASACFTKVVGIVFLGELRCPSTSTIRDAGPTMRAAMLILAATCIVIGFWPEPFILFTFHGLRDLAPFASLPVDILGTLPRSLAMTAWIVLGLLSMVALLRWLSYRSKFVSQNATWGCGFTQPTSRIQYTGTSYARELVDLHRPFVKVQTTSSPIDRIFPRTATYASKVEDWAEVGLQRFFLAPLIRVVDKLRWIQHGYIQLYIGYIVLTIAVLLLVL
jgi:hydrogenase-4 component B